MEWEKTNPCRNEWIVDHIILSTCMFHLNDSRFTALQGSF